MKQGTDILNSIIGKELREGKIQSLCLKGKTIDQINSTYLKFDKWIRIVTTDEMTKVYEIGNLEDELYLKLEDDFEFSIERIENYYTDFDKYFGQKLVNWKELVRKDAKAMSFGLKLIFENDLVFIVHNIDYPIDKNEFIFENKVPEHLIEI